MSETAPDDRESADGVAARLVLSYPENLSERTAERVAQDYYRKYLLRTHEHAAVGDMWPEFTDVGCCGSQIPIEFRVEAVEGGTKLTTETDIEFTTREDGEVEGGWTVQNEID